MIEGPLALALDAFHYLRDGAARPDAPALAGDLEDVDQGLSMRADIEPMAEAARALTQWAPGEAGDIPRLDAAQLAALFAGAKRAGLQLKAQDHGLTLVSRLAPGRHAYLYADAALPRAALNLVDNSQIKMEATQPDGMEIRCVFEFQDAAGAKLSHNMHRAGGDQSLTIPPDCAQVRLGLRVEGAGAARIGPLLLGAAEQRPALLFARSRRLVLTKQYPAPDDLYRYGFLHSRVRGYRAAGMDTDVFRLSTEGGAPFRRFDGVNVMTGDFVQLDALLASGRIDHVLAHLIDPAMWSVLSRHLDRVAVTVWVHGAEVQHWRRRAFEFERLSPAEIERQKALSDQRMAFWRGVMENPHPNLKLVFVSRHLAEEVMEDVGVRLPDSAHAIIHNPIDADLFAWRPKPAEQRARILSIRPYASRVYANDLSVAAILKLAREPFFKELSFRLIGDGPLFEETLAPLREMANVTIERGFLTQPQIAALHREHGVFLCPTRMDSQGVSRDEAMASGLVPVTSAVAAVPEFVDDDCAVLAPPEDADALAEGIAALWRDPDRFLRLSAAAAARVRRQSAADIVIPQEIALIERRAPQTGGGASAGRAARLPARSAARPPRLFIFGSCVSRDALNISPEGGVELAAYFARSAMASAFASAPVAGVALDGIDSTFQRRMVAADADKSLAASLERETFDILLHDPIDERFNLLRLSDGALLTYSPEFTRARDPLQGRATSTIVSGSPEFLAVWERGWRALLDLLDRRRLRGALRVNVVYWATRTESGAGLGADFPEARIRAANAFLAILYDKMAADLSPTQFLRFDDALMRAADDHKWGLSPFHYTDDLYRECVRQLVAGAENRS